MWEPLFALADHADGHWPQRAREAATRLHGADREDDATVRVQLLFDIKKVFRDDAALHTHELLDRLHGLEESPWADMRGREVNARFLANQLRVLMTAAAFVLFQELRHVLAGTELRRAMVGTLRLRLLKIGATIKESVRRIVISMPSSHPWKDLWRLAAERVAAIA